MKRAPKLKTPVTYDITWCNDGKHTRPQCAFCMRNRARFNWPKCMVYRAWAHTPKQLAAADNGACCHYKCDKSEKDLFKVRAIMLKALEKTGCKECRFKEWKKGEAAWICTNKYSQAYGTELPIKACGLFVRPSPDTQQEKDEKKARGNIIQTQDIAAEEEEEEVTPQPTYNDDWIERLINSD